MCFLIFKYYFEEIFWIIEVVKLRFVKVNEEIRMVFEVCEGDVWEYYDRGCEIKVCVVFFFFFWG